MLAVEPYGVCSSQTANEGSFPSLTTGRRSSFTFTINFTSVLRQGSEHLAAMNTAS
jgi:hypothetical protein